MKQLRIIMAAVFLFAVAVQYNDPDGLAWMIAYGLVVAVTLASIAGKKPWRLALLLGAALLLWGVLLSPAMGKASLGSFTHWSMHGNDEVVREVGGLALAAGWMFVLAFLDRRAVLAPVVMDDRSLLKNKHFR
jgi:Zn-dependent protease with chaperone function